MPRALADTFLQQATVEPAVDEVAVIVKGRSGQTAHLQQWQDSAAAVLARVGADGVFTFPSAQFGAVTPATSFGLPADNGTAATLARSDHTHGTPSGAEIDPIVWMGGM